MGNDARRRLPLWVAVGVLLAGVISPSDSRADLDLLAPFNRARDERVRDFVKIVELVQEKASQTTTEIELAALDTVLGRVSQATTGAFKARMGRALRQWTAHQNAVKSYGQRAETLTAAIAAEKARMSATLARTAEEGALEGVITQVKTELAGLEGRQQRAPLLEARLQAMPKRGFMDFAPRERLEAELAEARTNLTRPGEINKSQADLARYERELVLARQICPDTDQERTGALGATAEVFRARSGPSCAPASTARLRRAWPMAAA